MTEAVTPQPVAALVNLRADPEVEVCVSEFRRKANEGR